MKELYPNANEGDASSPGQHGGESGSVPEVEVDDTGEEMKAPRVQRSPVEPTQQEKEEHN